MKHLSSILLAAAFVVAGVTACFNDPTDPSMNGPSRINLSVAAITLRTGDSLAVTAELKDDAGNTFSAAAAEWTTADPLVAVVRLDTVIIPGEAFSRGFVRGIAANGGVTTVTVAVGGVTSEFRVLVLPAGLAATATPVVSGTARLDTILAVLPGGVVTRDIFTVGDTVTFSVVTGSRVYFSPTASQVSFGSNRAYIVARTDSTRIKVVARIPFRGRPWITALHYNAPTTAVGTVVVDSLQNETEVLVAKPRFLGAVTQTADTMFLDAPAGVTFRTTAPLSAVRFDTSLAIVLGRTAAQLKVISPIAWTGGVTVLNVMVGGVTLDSVKTPAAYTIGKASFGGTIVTAGNLLDTVKVYGTAVTKLDTGSVATIGGAAAWRLVRYPTTGSTTTLDSMFVLSRMPSTGVIAISRVNVGGTIIPSLNSTGNVVISETSTGELNEPANDNPGAVTISLTGKVAATPLVIFGAVDDAVDIDDFFAFTTTAVKTVTIQLQFTGTGGGGATNPDIDLLVCNAACSTWTSTAGATGAQPENITLTNLPAGTYNILVEAWDTGGTTRPYRLSVYTN